MAQTTNCSTITRYYAGNGSQTQYTVLTPYIYKDDICVYLLVNGSWVKQVDGTDYNFVNSATIEFSVPPDSPPAGVIYNLYIDRKTDVDQPIATFNPGSAIRARDLNDNFDQLIFAAQESACSIDELKNNPTYTLPVATASVLGGIKVGSNLSITADGTLSSTGGGGSGYVLPPASTGSLGGVIVGDGLSVSNTGKIDTDVQEAPNNANIYGRQGGNWTVISTSGGGVTKIVAGQNVSVTPSSGVGEVTIAAAGGGGSAYVLPPATNNTLGGVIVKDDSNINLTVAGEISVTGFIPLNDWSGIGALP
mgnify:CR=1 FL=1|tara:strand:+ start:663 stop:1583 length:921 start_codon:yes stop_codon:yes gene_type:complete